MSRGPSQPSGTEIKTVEAERACLDQVRSSGTDQKIAISFGRNCRDTNPQQTLMTFDELAARLLNPEVDRGTLPLLEYLALDKKVPAQNAIRTREKDGEYFIPAIFGRPGRKAADVVSIFSFVGDIDTGAITKAELTAKLAGTKYIAYSSYSHQPSVPRWRFLVPYVRPISPAEHHKAFAHFQALFENQLDTRCDTTSQLWYTPACPYDAAQDFEYCCGEGEFFDVALIPSIAAAVTSRAPATPNAPPQNYSANDIRRIQSALASIPADDRAVWVTVGMALHRDLGADSGQSLWLSWSSSSTKYEEVDAVSTWASFDAGRQDGVKLGTVFHLAKEHGWTDPLRGMPPELLALNGEHFVAMGGGSTWVYREIFDPVLKRFSLDRLTFAAFKGFYLNRFIKVLRDGETKAVKLAAEWLSHPGRRSYNAIVFMPGKSAPPGFYNLWRGFAVKPVSGCWSLMQKHIRDVICAGDLTSEAYLLNWMAFALQHPDRPGEVAVVLKGGRGTGKGKLASMFGALFGLHSLQITQLNHLVGHFNAHLQSCVLLFVDEALWAGDRQGESVLKGLITERTLVIEPKGQNVTTVSNCLHIMMASNSDWVIPAGPLERRFFVLQVGDQHVQDLPYFKAIDAQMLDQDGLAAMMFDLLARDLSAFDVRRVPKTAGLDEQVLMSVDPEMGWWIDHLRKPSTAAQWQYQPRVALRMGYAGSLGREQHGKGSETRFGMFLRKVLPGGAPRKVQHAIGGGGLQDCYKLPDQAACRKFMQKKLGLQSDPWK